MQRSFVTVCLFAGQSYGQSPVLKLCNFEISLTGLGMELKALSVSYLFRHGIKSPISLFNMATFHCCYVIVLNRSL